jgi:hypothetical protein
MGNMQFINPDMDQIVCQNVLACLSEYAFERQTVQLTDHQTVRRHNDLLTLLWLVKTAALQPQRSQFSLIQ